jgi:hypothetical protein
MNRQMTLFIRALALILLGSGFLVSAARAKIVSHSKDIVVEQPTDLPELAQRVGIDLQLYFGSGDGSAYLYIEQHHGERLLILDVTDPAHMKMVGAVTLSVPAPFDFVGPLGNSAMLVRFRNNQGIAVLDLRKAKAPTLRVFSGLDLLGYTLPLGDTGLLFVNGSRLNQQPTAQDYQIIDASTPAAPILLDTVKLVTNKITREETGTTFLLGSEGLTIIRRPRVEKEYQIQQDAMKN